MLDDVPKSLWKCDKIFNQAKMVSQKDQGHCYFVNLLNAKKHRMKFQLDFKKIYLLLIWEQQPLKWAQNQGIFYEMLNGQVLAPPNTHGLRDNARPIWGTMTYIDGSRAVPMSTVIYLSPNKEFRQYEEWTDLRVVNEKSRKNEDRPNFGT